MAENEVIGQEYKPIKKGEDFLIRGNFYLFVWGNDLTA